VTAGVEADGENKVVSLHKGIPADDIPAGLRRLADTIEAGMVDDMPVITTAVVVLGHSADKLEAGRPGEEGEVAHQSSWAMYGFGPRCDTFTIRGLLATSVTGE
jgi:hypothetical protein